MINNQSLRQNCSAVQDKKGRSENSPIYLDIVLSRCVQKLRWPRATLGLTAGGGKSKTWHKSIYRR